MKQNLLLMVAVCAALLLHSCAVIPTCTGNRMPIVEIQVNNSESNHDDYVGTGGFTPCRARITNVNKEFGSGQNFPGGVEVEFRNRRLSTDLIVSSTPAGSSASFFATLPGNGSWLNFNIRGNNLSAQDKAAIIEIATAGVSCSEVVVARKGLMVTNSAPPIPATGTPQVAIEVGSISTLDDYITWAPTFCRMKWLNPPSAAAVLETSVANMSGFNRLRFATASLATGTTATNTSINLNLPGNGNWVQFYVAGNRNNASVNDKDAIFEVRADGVLLAREGIMVRIRKNANLLGDEERDRYLEAMREVHQTYDLYETFQSSHSQSNLAHRQAHVGSAFLPWHRAFMLHIERLLQASDPSVALHYWRFDQTGNTNIFHPNFMGSNPTAPSAQAILNASNPISSWQITGQAAGIRRRTPYGNAGAPTGVANQITVLGLGGPSNLYSDFKTMEVQAHNGAHSGSSAVGSGTWIGGSPAIAPQDPLFYFLHSNVDRLWSVWQWTFNRYDPTQASTYDLQGGHFSSPSPATSLANNRTFGQYVDDSMWPWDNKTGTSQGTGTAERPATAPLTPFPIVLGGIWPGSQPTVKSTIDFRLLNFAYDDFFPY